MNTISDALKAQIAADALVSCGEGIRWDVLLHQKALTLGFLGGSITQGYRQYRVYDKAFPALAAEMLSGEFHCNIRTAVCAEAGSSSMIGNILADEQILSQKPDIVFLEYSINETTLPPSVLSFESLLRKMLLSSPEPPIVCLLLTRSACDYSCESFMLPLAEHYHLPCVNMRKSLNQAIRAGQMQWADFADAESHPNPEGHQLIAACILHLFRTASKLPQTPPLPLPQPWLGAPFLFMTRCLPGLPDCPDAFRTLEIFPTKEPFFPCAWRLSDTPFSFSLKCSALVLFYEEHHLPQYGSCRVLRDGVPMREPIRSNSIYGWGNVRYTILLQPDADKAEPIVHTFTLEPQNGDFYILAVAYH